MRQLFQTLLIFFLSSSAVLANNNETKSSSLTMTTYYPSPSGNYDKLYARNVGIGTNEALSNLDVNGDALVRGKIIASEFKTIDAKRALVTIILYDATGNKRECPKGYALIGQWTSSNGGNIFITRDYYGNTLPENATGVMGLCSSI